MTFYERLRFICKEKGTTVTNMLSNLGIATGSTGNWKRGSIPNGDILMKIADYLVFLAGGKVVFSGEKDELLDGYRLVKGDPGTLNAESREHIIGYRENQYGFEGLVDQNDLPLPASGLCYEKCSLDELILFIHKEVSRHEADMRFHKA